MSWSFEFENQPWFGGFRDLATNGGDKPVLNVFRMLGMMGGQRVQVTSPTALPLPGTPTQNLQSQQADLSALAATDGHSATVLVWNYHNNDLPALPTAQALVQHYRIDQEHSNAYTAWQRLGSPQTVSADQRTMLEQASQLALLTSPRWVSSKNGETVLPLTLPRQGVSLLRLSW